MSTVLHPVSGRRMLLTLSKELDWNMGFSSSQEDENHCQGNVRVRLPGNTHDIGHG